MAPSVDAYQVGDKCVYEEGNKLKAVCNKSTSNLYPICKLCQIGLKSNCDVRKFANENPDSEAAKKAITKYPKTKITI